MTKARPYSGSLPRNQHRLWGFDKVLSVRPCPSAPVRSDETYPPRGPQWTALPSRRPRHDGAHPGGPSLAGERGPSVPVRGTGPSPEREHAPKNRCDGSGYGHDRDDLGRLFENAIHRTAHRLTKPSIERHSAARIGLISRQSRGQKIFWECAFWGTARLSQEQTSHRRGCDKSCRPSRGMSTCYTGGYGRI